MANKKEPISVNLSKLILTVTVIVCIGALFGAVGYLLNRPAVILPINSEKIYTVDEILKVRDTNPESLKDKSILLKAYIVDAVDGIGCDDFYILTDYENVNFYQDYIKRYIEGKTTEEEKVKFDSIPRLEAAVRTVIQGGISEYAVLIGHFYDGWQIKNCDNGWTRFTITGIKETLALSVSDVTISTDKMEYEQGEIVKITIKNNSKEESDFYQGYGSLFAFAVEKISNGNWMEITNTEECPCEASCEALQLGALKSGETIEESWDQKEIICDFSNNPISKQAIPGKYRIRIVLKSLETIYSNEFMIKEKTVQNHEVSVVLDKTEYEKGETINGVFNFNKDIYINPDFKIYYFNNNDWEYLGEWSFSGDQYTCCGLMPTCEESFSKDSPVKFIWDQKVVKEELPILESMTKVQAHSGRYKITVVYGDKPVCIDGIDVEFTIK